MIFDFGPIIEYIQVTAQYSNAVLIAILPHVSDFAKKLELPVPIPITTNQVDHFYCNNHKNDPGGAVTLTNGWAFRFQWGYVDNFESPSNYFGLQNPDEIPKFYAPLKIDKPEAIELARQSIRKLGYPLESVFADVDPEVSTPPKLHGHVIPFYRITWNDPRGGGGTVIDVNGNAKRVERIHFGLSQNLRKRPPDIAVQPGELPKNSPLRRVSESHFNPAYGHALLPIVLTDLNDYAKKLSLPIPSPLTTNHVKRFFCDDNGGWPHCELELTNGWRFIFRNSMVNGYYAPDNFFNSNKRPITIREFTGKATMTEKEAIELIRRTIAKLNYPTNRVHMDFAPKVVEPSVPSIPRRAFWWNKLNAAGNDLESKIEAEVDMEKHQVKSLYHDDVSYWNHPPQIDVPIKLPMSVETNATPKTPFNAPRKGLPQRPLKKIPS